MTKKELEAEVTRLRCLLVDLVEEESRRVRLRQRSLKREREDLAEARDLAIRAIVRGETVPREEWEYWLFMAEGEAR